MEIQFKEPSLSEVKPGTMGVYKITFDDNHFYIGGSTNVRSRISQWKNAVNKKRVKNKNIQSLIPFCKTVNFELIDQVFNREEVRIREDYYIKKFWGNILILNRCPSAFNNKGIRLTNSEKERLIKCVNKCKHHVYTDLDRERSIKSAIARGVCQRVAKFDLDNNFIEQYCSVNGAARSTGIKSDFIREMFNGRSDKLRGFIFKKIDENGNIKENKPFIKKERKIGYAGTKLTELQKQHLKNMYESRLSKGILPTLAPKSVQMFDAKMILLNTFESISKAAKYINTTSGNVCKVLKGDRKTTKGCYFRYSSNQRSATMGYLICRKCVKCN